MQWWQIVGVIVACLWIIDRSIARQTDRIIAAIEEARGEIVSEFFYLDKVARRQSELDDEIKMSEEICQALNEGKVR